MANPATRWDIEITPADDPVIAAHFTCTSEEEPVTAAGDITVGPTGAIVIGRCEVKANVGLGVTLSVFRQVPLGEILAHASRSRAVAEYMRANLPARNDEADGRDHCPHCHQPARQPRDLSGSRYQAMSEDLLRQVALAYIEETGPGKDRGAGQRMAERFGRPEQTVRTWVARARKEGWLGSGTPGRMGAAPGPKLLASQAA